MSRGVAPDVRIDPRRRFIWYYKGARRKKVARKCGLVIQNQNETFNGQTEQSDKQLYVSILSGISGRGVKQKVLLGPAWMGKHMCILPLSYISEAANLLWQPEGKPPACIRMSHQSSHLPPSLRCF